MKLEMIIKIMLLLILTGEVQNISAQKYKVKDDLITKDKKELGKVVGEAGVGKTNFTISDMQGVAILTVTDDEFKTQNPFFNDISWYEAKFEDTGKTMKFYHGGICNVKCVLNHILAPKGIALEGSFIQNQDDIIAKADISEKLNTDTTAILEKHTRIVSLLKNNKILRDTEKPIGLVNASESSEMASVYKTLNIIQDNIIVGQMLIEQRVTSSSNLTFYDVYEQLYQPEGNTTSVPACKVTDSFMDLIFVTVIDNKEHKLRKDLNADIPRMLVTYLVGHGYL